VKFGFKFIIRIIYPDYIVLPGEVHKFIEV
jgi:hypothetical protein